MKFSKCLVLVIALFVVSCKSVSKGVDTPRKVKCESVVLVSESLEQNSFAGKVVAATDLDLGFRVAGIISQNSMADGTFVRKGDVIARLDSRDYELQLAATQAEYDAIKAEVDRVVALYADESVSAYDYDKATIGLRAIAAKLEAHKNALSDCSLRSPMDGYIVKSNFGRGEAVAAGTPVVSIISSTAPQITIDIPVKSYLKQDSFDSATAIFEPYGATQFTLKLSGVSPKGNLNQLYRVTFDVEPTPNGELPAVGMSGTVALNYRLAGDQMAEIPFSAVVERGGVNTIWVVEDGCVESRRVEIVKINSDGLCYINGGLSHGEMVVVAGVNSLKEGQRVDILSEVSASNIGGIK